MSTRFYSGQKDYITQLNQMDQSFADAMHYLTGSTINPLALGTAAPGVSSIYAREDHVHPSTGTTQSVGNNTTQYATTAFVQQALGNVLTKTLTSADVTLTAAEALYPIILVNGTLTANLNLIVPASTREWLVRNGTSGAFTVTVKTVSGTGVVVRQGMNRFLQCDGTNVNYAGTDMLGITLDGMNGGSVTGSLNLTSNLTVTGTSTQTGNASFGGTLGVTGAATLSSTLGVTGAATFSNNITQAGGANKLMMFSMQFRNGGAGYINPVIEGMADATADFFIRAYSGASTGTLRIGDTNTGAIALGAASIPTSAYGTFSVTGATTLNSTLAVTGNATFSGTGIYSNYLVATGNIVSRAFGSEGGQVVLGYAGQTTITGQANSTWNVDVDGTNNFRIFRQNASGVSMTPLYIYESTGNISTLADFGVGGNLTVTGNLTVNGSTTTYNSTTVTVDDPVFTIGGDTAPASDDNKDRGIEFRWHNGTAAKVGFFGFDDSTGKFTFIPDATNTSEVFAGTKGVIDADLTGNVTGNLTGNVAGNLTGATTVGGLLTVLNGADFYLKAPSATGDAADTGDLVFADSAGAEIHRLYHVPGSGWDSLGYRKLGGTTYKMFHTGHTIPATNGGTGLTSYAAGDLLYAATTSTFGKLSNVATGNVLLSGGVGAAPAYGKVGLTTHVSGTLGIANGGTNSTATPTAGGVVYGDGSAHQVTGAGTAKQVLQSNAAAAPTFVSLNSTYLTDWGTANVALNGGVSIDKSSTDLNVLQVTGFYRGQTMTNAPDQGWWYITVEGHNSTNVKQTATAFGTGATYAAGTTFVRVNNGGTWTAWQSVGGGATGGGADKVFNENDQTVNNNYTITTNKNAMSAGPVTIATGVTVTIPTGSVWTIV